MSTSWSGRVLVAAVVAIAVSCGTTPAGAAAGQADAPQVVRTGIFIQSISDVDLRTGSFVADFYLWFLWDGDLDPTLTYELTNAARDGLSARAGAVNEQNEPEPEVLDDGRKYQLLHVQGRFVQPFDVDEFPLDAQELAISVEDVRYDTTRLVYEFDPASGFQPDMSVPGWHPLPLTGRVSDHSYTTSFGYPGGETSVFSRVDMQLRLHRPGMSPLLKTIAPLLLIIFIALVSLLIDPQLLETRLTLATPALIAAVFLHFTSKAGLPDEGEFLLLDRIYLLSYVVILLVITASVFSHRLCGEARVAAALRLDRAVLRLLAPLFIVGIAILIVLR